MLSGSPGDVAETRGPKEPLSSPNAVAVWSDTIMGDTETRAVIMALSYLAEILYFASMERRGGKSGKSGSGCKMKKRRMLQAL